MDYVLGIDAGGTETVCLLADETGTIVAEARGSGANLSTAGPEVVEANLRDIVERVLGRRGIVPKAACLGMAGVDRPSDAAAIREIMGRLSPGTRVVVANDALVALAAGAGSGPGIVVISGTGSMVYGRNREGRIARASGWGYVMGDEGSGYWIGRRALVAVMRAGDGRGPATALTSAIFAHFGVDGEGGLDHVIYRGGTPMAAIAALGALVGRAQADGDGVAQVIMRRAAEELLLAARAVVDRLDMSRDSFPFVLAGGMFHAIPWLLRELQSRLPELAPGADVRQLEGEPATGAVRLALAALAG